MTKMSFAKNLKGSDFVVGAQPPSTQSLKFALSDLAAFFGGGGGTAAAGVALGLATAVAGLSLASAASANLFYTDGYYSTADGGETWYRRMAAIEASEPGMLTSADGIRLALLPKGPVCPEMFGAYGDDTNNDAAALATMEDWRIAHRKSGTEYGYSFGTVAVTLNPSRAYYCGTGTSSGVVGQNAGWNVYTTAFIQTPNGSGPSGLSSVIRVDDSTSGVIFHSGISAGTTGFTTDRGYSSTGSVARGLAVVGGFSSTESDNHGIQFRAKITLVDPYVTGFPGEGIFGDTFSHDGIHNDNTNGSSVIRPWSFGCRNGILYNYNDGNAIYTQNPMCFANRRYGIWYKDNYGGVIEGGNTASNGCVAGFPTQSFNNGHVFGVLPGQETWCSTNSPPTTATTNTGWYWIYDTGAATASVPQWVSGTTYRSGGSIRIDGGSTSGTISGHEVEGDQMPIECINGSKALVLGGLCTVIDAAGGAYGGHVQGDSATLLVNRSIEPIVDNAGAVGIPSARFTTGYFYNFDAKLSYYVNGAAVLGSPRTGWTADTGTAKRSANATYTAGAGLSFSATYVQAELTAMAMRLAAVEAALQDATRTIKAMKDDNLGHGFYAP